MGARKMPEKRNKRKENNKTTRAERKPKADLRAGGILVKKKSNTGVIKQKRAIHNGESHLINDPERIVSNTTPCVPTFTYSVKKGFCPISVVPSSVCPTTIYLPPRAFFSFS
jgi:hypothetical protein